MRYIILSALLLWGIGGFAQTEIYGRNAKAAREQVEEGPNTKFHGGAVLGAGMLFSIDEADSAQTTTGSWHLIYGIYGKHKLNRHLSAGWEIAYHRNVFSIKQDSSANVFSPGFEFDSDKFRWNHIGLGGFLRFNVGKRGNVLGKHLDLGGRIKYGVAVNRKLITKDGASPANLGSGQQEQIFKKLDFINNWQYEGFVRVGIQTFGIFVNYRASDLWRSSENVNAGNAFPELSRWTIGWDLRF